MVELFSMSLFMGCTAFRKTFLEFHGYLCLILFRVSGPCSRDQVLGIYSLSSLSLATCAKHSGFL